MVIAMFDRSLCSSRFLFNTVEPERRVKVLPVSPPRLKGLVRLCIINVRLNEHNINPLFSVPVY